MYLQRMNKNTVAATLEISARFFPGKTDRSMGKPSPGQSATETHGLSQLAVRKTVQFSESVKRSQR